MVDLNYNKLKSASVLEIYNYLKNEFANLFKSYNYVFKTYVEFEDIIKNTIA